jgi:hypothetical protein
MATHVPAYLDPRFRQSLPKNPDELSLVTKDTRLAPQLLYRDRATGEEFLVPNIWYNQPKFVRVRSAEYDVQVAKDRVAACETFLARMPCAAAQHNLRDAQELLARAEAIRVEMRAL